MRVLNICTDDWSNFSHDNAKALRSVGIDCEDIKRNRHKFGYAEQSRITSPGQMIKAVQKADVVQFVHSDAYSFVNLRPHLKGKRVFVIHAGTVYRQNPIGMNKIFQPYVEKEIIALGEFKRHCPDAIYLVGAVNVDSFKPKYLMGSRMKIIGHLPSNSTVKGTGHIRKMLQGHKRRKEFELYLNPNRVSYAIHIERLNNVDICVELFAATQGGKPYGSWGITALEAAALGKVVVTNHFWKDIYQEAYGDIELRVANTHQEFVSEIDELVTMSNKELRKIQLDTRSWIKRRHSYEATGTYYKENIL